MTPSPSSAATYVFCVLQSARAPSLRGVPPSLPGAGAPRLIPVDRDLWAVVADAPLRSFSEAQIQRDLQDLDRISRQALAHASVIEFFFRRSPVVPLKLFTLFAGDERARAHLHRRRATFRRLVRQVRGFEEWGVRISIDRAAETPPAKAPSSGRDYLEVKRRLRNQAPVAPAAARVAADALGSLRTLAAKVRRETFPPPSAGRPLVAGGSFLVRADRRAVWKTRVARLAAALARRGHRLELSGPWPPYHFVANR